MYMLLFLLLSSQPPGSTLFPYTTLFRSADRGPGAAVRGDVDVRDRARWRWLQRDDHGAWRDLQRDLPVCGALLHGVHGEHRSEEHTSELQSPDHLVCRLLLEKKKRYRIW